MNLDIIKTKEYYHSLSIESLCNCAYCNNYRFHIKNVYPNVAEYLTSLGIDIEKPFEVSALEPNEDGMLEYCCCQYIVFGDCEPQYYHKIDNVEFRVAVSYPSTGIEHKHFVIEFYPIKLKYIEQI